MKRIIISLLLCPIAMMAMEQQNANDKIEYAGIVTHVVSEATYAGKPYIFACEEDMIVYKRNEQNTFDCAARNSANYIIPSLTNIIKPFPKELSLIDFQIPTVEILKSNDQLVANIKTILTTIGDQHQKPLCESRITATLPIGTSTRSVPVFTNPRPHDSSLYGIPTIFQRTGPRPEYRPGMTCKAAELIEKNNGVAQFSIHEPTDPSIINLLLRVPQPHPLAVVVAFLKLEKQNDKYVPAPSEISNIID